MQFVNVEITKNYARLILNRSPVNSMNLQVWEELTQALTALESNPAIRGVIIQSGLSRNVFTVSSSKTGTLI
jgi:enoyl-CoA hydratase/carnithine racemase